MNEPINGAVLERGPLEPETPRQALKTAEDRLRNAALHQPLHPVQAIGQAYVMAIMNAAKVNAMYDFLTTPANATWTAEEHLESLLARHLDAKAQELEATAAQQSAIQRVPPHVRVS